MKKFAGVTGIVACMVVIVAMVFSLADTRACYAAVNAASLSNILYFPQLKTEPGWETTISLENSGNDVAHILIYAYDKTGKLSGPVACVNTIQTGDTLTLGSKTLPFGTFTLKVESDKALAGSAEFISTDGAKSEVVPAISTLAGELVFPLLTPVDFGSKKIAILNPGSSFAVIEIIALDYVGNELARYSRLVTSMENFTFSPADVFCGCLSDKLSVIKVVSGKNNSAGLQVVDMPGGDIACLPGLNTTSKGWTFPIQRNAGGFDLWSKVGIYNPDSAAADISLEAFDADGSSIGSLSGISVHPDSSSVVSTANLSGEIPVGSALLKATSTVPVSGYEVVGVVNGKGITAFQGIPEEVVSQANIEIHITGNGCLINSNPAVVSMLSTNFENNDPGFPQPQSMPNTITTFSASTSAVCSSGVPCSADALSGAVGSIPVFYPLLQTQYTTVEQCLFGNYMGKYNHAGIDVDTSNNNPDVRSVCKGKVVCNTTNGKNSQGVSYANSYQKYWNAVLIIAHDYNNDGVVDFYGYYGHINSVLAVGAPVDAGQIMGKIRDAYPNALLPELKNIGWNHLHFGINNKQLILSNWGYYGNSCNDVVNGGWVDPRAYLRYSTPADATKPGSVSAPTPTVCWISSPQNINISCSNATKIYYTINVTTDGTTPADPPEPTTNSSSVSGSSGSVQLYADAGQFKNIKLRFRGYNSAGYGPATGSYLYSIDLRAKDTTKPSVTAFNVTPATINVGGTVTISYTVSDGGGSGLKQVELWLSKDGGTWSNISTKPVSGSSPTSGMFTHSPASAGSYSYGVHVVDNANNWDSEHGPKNVTVNAVTQGSTVNPASGTWTSSPQTISVTCTGATKIYYTISTTTDGTTPAEPPIPTALNSYVSGSSGNIQLYAVTGQQKKIKIRIRPLLSTGLGQATGSYLYTINLKSGNTAPPVLKIDGGTSSTRQQGGTYVTACTGLTPGTATTRYMNQPNGTQVVLTPTLTANASGQIDWSYPSNCSTPAGTYYIWVRDNTSGKDSNGVYEVVSANPSCTANPVLKMDGGTSSTRQQGGTFVTTCTGLTPGTATTRYMNQPNGTQVVLTPTLTANASGQISWSYTSDCSTPAGNYYIWVKDTASGKSSNGVNEIVTANPNCAPVYEGWVDTADCSSIRGWAWNKNAPNTPISVDIYDGSTKLTTITAGDYRADLVNAGKGNGSHGFNYTTPGSVKNGSTHTIEVKFGGTGTKLSGSGKSVNCAGHVSVSQGASISANPVKLGVNFTISFTLKECWGASKTLEEVAIAILYPNGTFAFDFAKFPQVTISANGTKSYTATNYIYTSKPTGTYRVVIRGKVNGQWFDFDTTGSGVTPKSFSVVK